jgi:hypothetical protein
LGKWCRLDRRRRRVAGAQDDVLAVDVHGQLTVDDLEALGEGEVAVQRVAAVGRDLELDQRALAAALLAGLEEGRAVALDRVVEAARLDGGGGCGQWSLLVRGLGPPQCADTRARVVVRDDDPASSYRTTERAGRDNRPHGLALAVVR